MTKKSVSGNPTLDSVEEMLDQFIDLDDETSTVYKRLKLLAELRYNLLLATRGLGPEQLERVKFVFMRLEILDGCIAATRQMELYKELGGESLKE